MKQKSQLSSRIICWFIAIYWLISCYILQVRYTGWALYYNLLREGIAGGQLIITDSELWTLRTVNFCSTDTQRSMGRCKAHWAHRPVWDCRSIWDWPVVKDFTGCQYYILCKVLLRVIWVVASQALRMSHCCSYEWWLSPIPDQCGQNLASKCNITSCPIATRILA